MAPNLFPIVEHLTDGFPFHHLAVGTLEVADGLGIVAPLLQQLQALGEQAGFQRAVLVVGIKSGKLVQVLALGTHLLALEGDNLLAQADVVIALGHRPGELKFAREHALQEVDTLLVDVCDAERLVMGKTLVAQGTDDAFQTTVARLGQLRVFNPLGRWRYRHGVGVLSVIDEPQHQIPLDDGIFQPEAVPREQVHAAPFAALDIFPP